MALVRFSPFNPVSLRRPGAVRERQLKVVKRGADAAGVLTLILHMLEFSA